MAEAAKSKGNAAFAAGRFDEAVRHFSDAIELSPSNHVLYSNRSAAFASLHRYSDALSDAKSTIKLNSCWPKGYGRLGAAHLGLGNFNDAIFSYKKGLDFDPNNEALKAGLADAESAAARAAESPPPAAASPFGSIFQGPDLWAKLTADPMTRGFLQQPDFVNMVQEVQRNPSSLNMYLSDQRMVQVLSVLLNVKMRAQTDDNHDMEREFPEKPQPEPAKKGTEATLDEATMDARDDEKEGRERKAEAQREKEAGNAAYKKKEFETAIQHYSKAVEIDDEDISFLTNRAAVYMEMGKVIALPVYLVCV